MLVSLTTAAANQGRLVVSPEQAAAHILAANVGVTLRQIVLAQTDRELSDAMREATIAAITGTTTSPGSDLPAAAHHLLAVRPAAAPLTPEETALLRTWLLRLGGAA